MRVDTLPHLHTHSHTGAHTPAVSLPLLSQFSEAHCSLDLDPDSDTSASRCNLKRPGAWGLQPASETHVPLGHSPTLTFCAADASRQLHVAHEALDSYLGSLSGRRSWTPLLGSCSSAWRPAPACSPSASWELHPRPAESEPAFQPDPQSTGADPECAEDLQRRPASPRALSQLPG